MRRTPTMLLVALLAGCSVSLPVEPAPPTPPVPSTVGAAEAAALLSGLRVTERPRADGSYRRDAFGPAWTDTDGNGCNQRDDVLLRDAEPDTAVVAVQRRCDHDVLAGTWVDPYTGATLVLTDLKDPVQARSLQIDHVVPLAEAWISGAAAWTEDRRRQYANDLDVLLAVDGSANASKGADDPAAWRPVQAYQCTYAERWIQVKQRWELSVDASEVAALTEMLGFC